MLELSPLQRPVHHFALSEAFANPVFLENEQQGNLRRTEKEYPPFVCHFHWTVPRAAHTNQIRKRLDSGTGWQTGAHGWPSWMNTQLLLSLPQSDCDSLVRWLVRYSDETGLRVAHRMRTTWWRCYRYGCHAAVMIHWLRTRIDSMEIHKALTGFQSCWCCSVKAFLFAKKPVLAAVEVSLGFGTSLTSSAVSCLHRRLERWFSSRLTLKGRPEDTGTPSKVMHFAKVAKWVLGTGWVH